AHSRDAQSSGRADAGDARARSGARAIRLVRPGDQAGTCLAPLCRSFSSPRWGEVRNIETIFYPIQKRRSAMRIVHLTASTFFGGPERQMLGLAETLRPEFETNFVSFAEGGRCEALLSECRHAGFRAEALENDTPHLRAAARELTALLRDLGADVVCSHGY